MYSVTLSPSTMLKIRNYNKKYSYYSMYELGNYVSMTKDDVGKDDEGAYKLRCNNDGRECYSEFLRSEIFTQNSLIDGDCFLGRDTQDETKIRKEFDEISSSFIFTEDITNEYVKRLFRGIDTEHAVTYNGDVNHNGRIDSEDLELMLSYADSYIYKTEAEEDEAQNNDKEYDASAAHTSVKHNKYYTCANKTYKSGGPVKEAE